MERLFLKPAPIDAEKTDLGLRVIPNPEQRNRPLPAEGQWVTRSTYWNRRFQDEDVVNDTEQQLKREAEAEEQAAAEAAKATKKKGAA